MALLAGGAGIRASTSRASHARETVQSHLKDRVGGIAAERDARSQTMMPMSGPQCQCARPPQALIAAITDSQEPRVSRHLSLGSHRA